MLCTECTCSTLCRHVCCLFSPIKRKIKSNQIKMWSTYRPWRPVFTAGLRWQHGWRALTKLQLCRDLRTFACLEEKELDGRKSSVTLVLLSRHGRIDLKQKMCLVPEWVESSRVSRAGTVRWTSVTGVEDLNVLFCYLTGLFALHDLEDRVLQGVVDEGRGCGLHVLLHQGAR